MKRNNVVALVRAHVAEATERIAALERDVSGIIADITYIYERVNIPVRKSGIPRPDAAATPLTAADAQWLVNGDLLEHCSGGVMPYAGPHEMEDSVYLAWPDGRPTQAYISNCTPTPATAAKIAARRAAELAVGDKVEVTGPARMGDTVHPIGTVTTICHDWGDGEYTVAEPSYGLRIVYPASSLRKLPAETPDMQPAATAEQPAPAADLRREIEAALKRRGPESFVEWAYRIKRAIRAAAAVPRIAPPAVSRRYAKAYNAGQSSILAPILAALKGDTHEQR